MAKLYAKRIIAGTMTIEEVPERWRQATEELVAEMTNTAGE